MQCCQYLIQANINREPGLMEEQSHLIPQSCMSRWTLEHIHQTVGHHCTLCGELLPAGFAVCLAQLAIVSINEQPFSRISILNQPQRQLVRKNSLFHFTHFVLFLLIFSSVSSCFTSRSSTWWQCQCKTKFYSANCNFLITNIPILYSKHRA